MCQFATSWQDPAMAFAEIPQVLDSLKEMEADKLLHIGDQQLIVPDAGKPFIRNICMAFDLRLRRKMPETKIFSMTV